MNTSELIWYSRLFVWVGAGGLLLQAVAQGFVGQRVNAPLALLCVLLLGGGFILFVVCLALEGSPVHVSAPVTAPAPAAEPPLDPSTPVQTQAADSPAVSNQIKDASPISAPTEAAVTAKHSTAAPPTTRIASSRTVQTIELAEGDGLIGAVCPVCEQRLRVDQLAAACPECGLAHHASCWTENRFRCGRQGCSGSGSLQAPSARESAEDG
jgi:Prokaryotic RING finger family 1